MRKAALALAALVGAAQAQTGPHFIHGSWVNVRDAGANTARAIEQLTTNVPVEVTARQGDWCALRYGAGKAGFVACNLLGPKPLTLADAAGNPARAFWIAPSPNRLANYGLSFPRFSMVRLDKLKAFEPLRFPPVAEFEAAKKRMKAGVVLDPTLEVVSRKSASPPAELAGYKLRPTPIKPSLFRTHHGVVLLPEADADGFAGVTGSRVSLTPTTLPAGWYSRHNGPEVEGINGFWDVGDALLTFAPAMTLYSVAANGLVSAAAVRALPFNVGGVGHYCGWQYLGKSLPVSESVLRGGAAEDRSDVAPLRGFPLLKEGSEVLVSLAVPGSTALRPSAKVRTQSEPVRGLKYSDGELATDTLLKPMVVLREIDFDGDGVTDVLQIQTPRYAGRISVDVVYRRAWFLNINGQWVAAGVWEDEDCT
jgi:hypothetical protein